VTYVKESNDKKVPEYAKFLDGSVKVQLEIAKLFDKNMKKKKELLDKR
jgi:hypothetical protein